MDPVDFVNPLSEFWRDVDVWKTRKTRCWVCFISTFRHETATELYTDEKGSIGRFQALIRALRVVSHLRNGLWAADALWSDNQ